MVVLVCLLWFLDLLCFTSGVKTTRSAADVVKRRWFKKNGFSLGQVFDLGHGWPFNADGHGPLTWCNHNWHESMMGWIGAPLLASC